jgi:hypothetical protein
MEVKPVFLSDIYFWNSKLNRIQSISLGLLPMENTQHVQFGKFFSPFAEYCTRISVMNLERTASIIVMHLCSYADCYDQSFGDY